VTLTHALITLSSDTPSSNPLLVFGNYLFDRFISPPIIQFLSCSLLSLLCSFLDCSLTADAFTVKRNVADPDQGELYETKLALRDTSSSGEIDSGGIPQTCSYEWSHDLLQQLKCTPGEVNETIDYYHHPSLDALLSSLANQLLHFGPSASTFTIPIGGLLCLERVRLLSRDQILISFLADKGYHRCVRLGTLHSQSPHNLFPVLISYMDSLILSSHLMVLYHSLSISLPFKNISSPLDIASSLSLILLHSTLPFAHLVCTTLLFHISLKPFTMD
jgi:hypothetical protein